MNTKEVFHLLVQQRYLPNGNFKHDVLEHYPNAGDCTCAVDVPQPDVRIKRIDILLNRTREDYATKNELREDMNRVMEALHRVEDKLDRALSK